MIRPRRVLHVTRDFPPNINGGLSIAVGGLAAAQGRAGLECLVVSFDDYRHTSGGTRAPSMARTSTTEDGIGVIHVGNADDLSSAEDLAAEFGGDIIHVHHGLLWDFAAAVADRTAAPTVLTVHVLQAEQNRLRGIETTHSSQAQARALAECSVVHAPSEAVARLLEESDPALAERLRVVRLGCGAWPGAEAARQCRRFGPAPQLLYVGRFADINGFAELLAALPALFEAHPTLRMTIAGGMPDNPRAEKRWKKRWREIGGTQADRLTWTGWLEGDALSALYGEASVLLVPSWFETFGQVLIEGMLHGTPIVTTGAGALGELADNDTALLIEAKNSRAITEAVLETLEAPDAALARRDRATERVRDGHSWDDRVEEFQTLYVGNSRV